MSWIPVEEIRSVQLSNPYLWKRWKKQKQGIVDLLVELNDDSKVNIELQIRFVRNWDRRNLFYLAKMFTEDLLVGEDYRRLKRCICISILDFNLDEHPRYHRIYRLRDEYGHEFSDMFEVHIVELNKTLAGNGRLDEWIRLINTDSEEAREMLQAETKNPGILAALREVKVMGLGKNMRALYEQRMKEIRDQKARDGYMYDEGLTAGEEIGKQMGEEMGRMYEKVELVCKKLAKGKSQKEIAEELEEELEVIEKICAVAHGCGMDVKRICDALL